MTAAVRFVAHVSGDVQGVGFRDWVRRRARDTDVVGSATNLRDGRVRVIAEGSRAACESLLDALHSSNTPGSVLDVEVVWEPARGESGFTAG